MDRIFHYDPHVLSKFPNLHSGLLLAEGVHNMPSPTGLLDSFRREQKVVLENIGQTPLSEISSLAAWRAAFRKFGVDPTQYRSAAEALLRRLTKKGDIPSINALADMANMVSIHYALPVAAFDLDRLKLPITVRFADGSERYTPLDEDIVEHPVPGEVIFADETGLVVARRWCYRQGNESAVREGTRRVLFTIEAQHVGNEGEVHQATSELLDLINQYVGGNCQTAWLP
jgi:DNA/RNA-binding domain of Phe-tRNA-synthetase-like protein